ncbi:putative Ig domain-containing protein, partial [Macrococcus caseolyticus]
TTAPDVDPVEDQTTEVNTPIKDVTLNGKDNSGKPVTHEVSGLPEGVTYDPKTNTISGTPTKPGEYTVTVVTRDSEGNETTTKFVIIVKDDSSNDGNNPGDDEDDDNSGDNGDDSSNDGNDNSGDNGDDSTNGGNDNSGDNGNNSSNDGNDSKELPDTGEQDKNLTLFASVIALFGGILTFRRKKKDSKTDK